MNTPITEWISVECRLPENGEIVLSIDNNCENDYSHPYKPEESIVTSFYSTVRSCWFDSVEHDEVNTPTHWMPLPPPPTRSKE